MRVLVTGGASGIGRATCVRLARDARARGSKAYIAAVDLAGTGTILAVNTRGDLAAGQGRPSGAQEPRGAIVATGSMSGSHPHANLGAYGPSKAAVIMLVRVLAQEFGRDGVRVNSVSPGMVRTGMTAAVYADAALAAERDALVPIGRVATAEDMADVIAFLLGPDARYVNGHDLVVDGGVSGNFLGRLPGIARIPRG
jgi:glucose 1-dehydrogenase